MKYNKFNKKTFHKINKNLKIINNNKIINQ